MREDEYPVIIEITTQHVVWVEGSDLADALANAKQSPFYELTDDQKTAVTWWDDARSPDKWSWDLVYEPSYDGTYAGMRCDAHVQAHQAEQLRQQYKAEKAACTEAGHPNAEPPLADGRRWCPGCRGYLPTPEAAR